MDWRLNLGCSPLHQQVAACGLCPRASLSQGRQQQAVSSDISLEVSKALTRFKQQRIDPTPKIVHHVKKKEACKARRREKKEKEKADRVTGPVWYSWSEDEALTEKNALNSAAIEEAVADDFLCLIGEQKPPKRISLNSEEAPMAASLPRRKLWRPRESGIFRQRGGRRSSELHIISTTNVRSPDLANKCTEVPTSEDILPSRQEAFCIQSDSTRKDSSACEVSTDKVLETDMNATIKKRNLYCSGNGEPGPGSYSMLNEDYEYRNKVSDYRRDKHSNALFGDQLPNDISKDIRDSLWWTETHKDSESKVEQFVDDEIEDMPKKPEIWIKGVGTVEKKKSFSAEKLEEMLIAQRQVDWMTFYDSEEDAEAMNKNVVSTFQFDGKAAILEDKRIQKLASRLNAINYWTAKLQFAKVMHSGRMKFTEDRVLRIVEILGEWGNWRRAMQVVQWVHKRQRHQFRKSKFIFTTLISVLGRAKRPVEALNVFNVMRENFSSYPDQAAYHAISDILGKAGHLKELLQLIESLKIGPPKPIKFVPMFNWDPSLQPDIVIYNAVLNACISTKEWMGVLWTWDQIDKQGIRPNGATFGLTIEAMVKAGNFDQAIRYYRRMDRAGYPANAQTYKCLVEAFGKAKKLEEAIELVKEMEASGTVPTASVYYVLACSLCTVGRLKEALAQVRKLQDLPSKKPDVITYTGMIQACVREGRTEEAIFIFDHMQHTCSPNIRTCNEMIKIYGQSRMFEEARKLYESVKRGKLESSSNLEDFCKLRCDAFTFELMLKAAAVTGKWDYFCDVYKDMTSKGYHLSCRTSLWLMVRTAREKKIELVDDMISRLQKAGETPPISLYETQILACLQGNDIQRGLLHLTNMKEDGHDPASTWITLQKQLCSEVRDSILKAVNFGSSELQTLLI